MKAESRHLPDMGDHVVIRYDGDQIVHEVALTADRTATLTCMLDALADSDPNSQVDYRYLTIVDRKLTCMVCIALEFL